MITWKHKKFLTNRKWHDRLHILGPFSRVLILSFNSGFPSINFSLYSAINNNYCIFFCLNYVNFHAKFFKSDFISDDTLKQFLFRNSSMYVGCNSFVVKLKSYVKFGAATNDFKTGDDTCLLPCTISLIQLSLFSQRKPVSLFKTIKLSGWLVDQ